MAAVLDDKVVARFKKRSYKEHATHIAELRCKKETLEAELSEINKMYDLITIQVLPTKMEDDGYKNLTIEGVGRFEIRPDMYVNTPADKRFDLQRWLTDKGDEALIQPTVNGSTLKAYIKERIQMGLEIPSEICNIQPYTRVVLVESKG